MMRRFGMHSLRLGFLSGCLLGLVASCDQMSNNNNTDMGMGDGGTVQQEQNLCNGAGCVGAPCAQPSDCTEGNSALPAVCWGTTLLNVSQNVRTPGGYCTRECSVDADCGTAACVQLPGSAKKHCMAKCASATRCRKPGYSCAFDGTSGGICFPNGNFDCNPAGPEGTCEYGSNGYLGGCIRVAYESDHGGICHLQCQLGSKTCPPDDRAGTPAPPQSCIYVDTSFDVQGNPSPTGDKFKGNLCFQQTSAPKALGEPCQYYSECQDSLQCDRFNTNPALRVCRALCVQGTQGVPPEPIGLFKPAGSMPVGNVCSNAAETCTNALRAGQGEGKPGLCTPR